MGTVTGTISAANQQVGGLINTAEDINQANADIIDQLKGLPNANREPLQSAIATLESRNSELAGALGNLDSLNTTIGNASTDTAGLAQHLNTATQTTVREANTARGTITSGAIPQLNTGLTPSARPPALCRPASRRKAHSSISRSIPSTNSTKQPPPR